MYGLTLRYGYGIRWLFGIRAAYEATVREYEPFVADRRIGRPGRRF